MSNFIITQNETGVKPVSDTEVLSWFASRGAKFVLCTGRSKKPTYPGWQNKPYEIDDAARHAKSGGNVGLLTGEHSNNIVILDRDVDFPETIEALGELAQTAKVVRKDAPERGKLLYRIVGGDMPKTMMWKAQPNDKHPAAEFLANGRHGVIPPSVHEDGASYVLVDAAYDIKEVTPTEMDFIWFVITGEHLVGTQTNTTAEAKANKEVGSDDYVQRVKNAWSVVKVFEHFGIDANGTKTERNGDIRFLGNGGLLVNSEKDLWYCYSSMLGGDVLDAWSWCKTGEVISRSSPKAFLSVVDEMAKEARIKPTKHETVTVGRAGAATEIADALDALGYHLSLNTLENEVYVNGQPMTDIESDTIQCKLADMGIKNFSLMTKVFNMQASLDRFNPIVDYFNGLEWDGVDHFSRLLEFIKFAPRTIKYKDGRVDDFSRVVFKKWLIGVVTQIMEAHTDSSPTRFQNPMLVLAGAQGAGKSSFARWICPINPSDYHIEGSLDPHDIEHHRLAVSKIIWEVTELGATMRKADKDSLKSFLTAAKSTYRPPWGKKPITKNRIVSYIGTINPETGFLNDVTGERRYAPVDVVHIDWGYATQIDINQLWAQVMHEYVSEVSPVLTAEEKALLAEMQVDHKIDNPLMTVFQQVFDIDASDKDAKMHTADIVRAFERSVYTAPGMLPSDLKFASTKIAEVLIALGLEPSKNMKIDGIQGKGYVGISPKGGNGERL